jgi:predicted house-cleaning noncanonical NTP pyrophosphatase (MazG superfamily)
LSSSINAKTKPNKGKKRGGILPPRFLAKRTIMEEPVVKRFTMEKLVRDKIPIIMKEQGFSFSSVSLNRKEFVQQLKSKLIEEAQEAGAAQSATDVMEELADLAEVVHALAKAYEISLEQIEQARLEKRESRGGFDTQTYVKYVDIDDSNPNIRYFADRPNKYREIETTSKF